MGSLRAFDVRDIDDLLRMLRFHSSLPDGSLGFRLYTARRILTLSLENEGLEEAKTRLDDIKEIDCLRPVLLQRLQLWVEHLPASTSFSMLSMSGARFHQHYLREIIRLTTEPEIIQNTVRERLLITFVFYSQECHRE